jgi:CTP:molybdopterin cytidylyltransferase MocA
MTTMDAIILAGEKEGSIPVMGVNKAFLPVKDRPIIEYVIDALDRAEKVSSITVVGPRQDLADKLAAFPTAKPLKFLEQGRNIFENMWRGALSTFPGHEDGAGVEELRQGPQADKAVAALTCDMPLVEPIEIDRFIATAPLDRADLVFGVTREEMLKPYEPAGDDPGIKFICFCMRDIIFRHANIFLFRPLKLGRVMDHYVPIVYGLRYQRRFKNILAATREFFRFACGGRNLYLFFLLESASWCHNHGLFRLRQLLRRPTELRWSEDIASTIFETRVAIHETIGPGLTLDVDDDDSYRAFLEMFDRWKKLQKAQIISSAPAIDAAAQKIHG